MFAVMQEATTAIASEISKTDKAVAEIDERIHILKKAWHTAGSTQARKGLFCFVPTQKLTKCFPPDCNCHADLYSNVDGVQ